MVRQGWGAVDQDVGFFLEEARGRGEVGDVGWEEGDCGGGCGGGEGMRLGGRVLGGYAHCGGGEAVDVVGVPGG